MVHVRSAMLPTGKANQDDLRRLFAKPGPHVFKDAMIPISFVGHHVAEFLLLSTCSNSLETNFSFSNAISWCDEPQLTSLLRIAVLNRNSQFVSILIEAGADVNDRDSHGASLISSGVKSGNSEVLQMLIESGSTFDDKIDQYLVHEAASMNRVDLLEILCLGYVDINLNSVNSQGQTALHIAAIHGHVESLQFLVSIGSNTDIADSENWTPLHYAANNGHVEAVEFLLGQSVFAKHAVTKDGKTAFALAVEMGYTLLYDSLHLGDLLHRAARIDDLHVMKSCLAQGAKVNGKDQNGWTPLHRAAFKGNMESVKLLVSHGARVDLVDDTGYTPLLRAVEAGQVQVAMYLLAHGAKANLKSLGVMSYDHMEDFKNHPALVSPMHQEKA